MLEDLIEIKKTHDYDKKCKHESCLVFFDLDQAKKMKKSEIREKYPRFFGKCQDCKVEIIKYASKAHYVYVDG